MNSLLASSILFLVSLFFEIFIILLTVVTASLVKSPGLSVDLNNTVLSILSTRFLISKSSSRCTNPLMTVPSALITIGITVTFMFHSFLSSLARSKYLSLFSLSFSFTLWTAGTSKSPIRQVLFSFLLTVTRSGHLAENKWSVCVLKSERIWFL